MIEYHYTRKKINLKKFIEESGFNPGLRLKANDLWFEFPNELSPEDKLKLDSAYENHTP